MSNIVLPIRNLLLSCLNITFIGLVTSVEEERADLFAIVYSLLYSFVQRGLVLSVANRTNGDQRSLNVLAANDTIGRINRAIDTYGATTAANDAIGRSKSVNGTAGENVDQ